MLKKIVLLVFIWSAAFGTQAQSFYRGWEFFYLDFNMKELYEKGYYEEAITYAENAVTDAKKTTGKKHLYYANSLNNLAFLYEWMGRYVEAVPLYKQVMKIAKDQLGEEHPEYATSINNLATLYRSMGRYAEAELLYSKTMGIYKAKLGEDHPIYATSLNNLAGLFHRMGRFPEAEPLYIQAIEIRRVQLGEDHPAYASSLNNLALLYQNMGHHDESEQLFTQAIGIFKAKLSDDHPDYATSLNNLALLYQNRKRYAEAEPLYTRAIEIRKAKLGEDHPDYATSLNNLAGMYHITFQYDKAGAVNQEIQRLSEEILKRGETDREQVPRNLFASGEELLKTANSRPFINIYTPDPLQRNERGVTRLTNANFTLKGFANAADGIQTLRVNGKNVPLLLPEGAWQSTVHLEEGENRVIIQAISFSGEETQYTLLLRYENEELARTAKPHRYLLAVGINDYDYEQWEKLKMPVKDSYDLVTILVEKYGITDVDTLFNQSASFANVRDRLKHLIGATRPQDEVIVFFAGHGEYDEDFDEDGKWILANGRFGNANLAAVIEKMEAKHVVVLADACFSGSFYLKRGEGQEAAEVRNQRRSRWVVASGGMETVDDQMPGKQNSPFAWHLIDFLKKAEGDVPLSTLRDHLETQVPKYADQHPISGPIRSDDGGEFIFRQKAKKLESTP